MDLRDYLKEVKTGTVVLYMVKYYIVRCLFKGAKRTEKSLEQYWLLRRCGVVLIMSHVQDW